MRTPFSAPRRVGAGVLLAGAWLCLLAGPPAFARAAPSVPAAAARWDTWRAGRLAAPAAKAFPRFAWASFTASSTQAEFGLYAAASFTEVQVKAEPGPMAAAAKAGLGMLLGTWDQATTHPETLDRLLGLARQNQGVEMMLFQDEPSRPVLLDIGAANDALFAKTDGRVLPLQTVLPAHASTRENPERFDPRLPCEADSSYCDFVDAIIAEAKPSALLATLYPIWEGGRDRPGYDEELDLLRKRTQAAGIGLFGFVLVTPHNDGWTRPMRFRRPDRSDLHWQAYTLLAHNAKGIVYYNYRPRLSDLDDPKFQYGDGIVTAAGGEPTESYALVRELNCELQAVGRVLLGLETSLVYQGGGPSALPPTVEGLDGDGVTLAAMDAPGGGSPHLLVVNTRHGPQADTARVALQLPAGYTATRLRPTPECGLRRDAPGGAKEKLTLEIEAGGGALLKLHPPAAPGAARTLRNLGNTRPGKKQAGPA